jgi:hypothetical protein
MTMRSDIVTMQLVGGGRGEHNCGQ